MYGKKIAQCAAHEKSPIFKVKSYNKRNLGTGRNIQGGSFVYTSAAACDAARDWIVKTPRWQPRGHDTQSFRPLVQEEVVSAGRDYSSFERVSILQPSASIALT